MTETANKQGARVQAPKQVVVVGAGVVGVATALALQSYGVSVTLIDRGEPGMECSYGNSGAISPGSVAPLALPGILKTVPGMLMDQDGPLSIGWKHLPKAASWLVAFAQSAEPKRVAAAAERLNDLYQGAVDAHAALAQSLGVSDLFMRRGHLHLYPDADYAQRMPPAGSCAPSTATRLRSWTVPASRRWSPKRPRAMPMAATWPTTAPS